MIRRTCDQCGRSYEAERSTSRFCGSSCRVRSHEGVPPSVGDDRVVSLPTAPEVDGALTAQVRATLAGVGRVETWQGAAALSIAARIDAGADPGSGLAALQRELRATMVEAMRGVGAPQSRVTGMRDELQRRRQARGSA